MKKGCCKAVQEFECEMLPSENAELSDILNKILPEEPIQLRIAHQRFPIRTLNASGLPSILEVCDAIDIPLELTDGTRVNPILDQARPHVSESSNTFKLEDGPAIMEQLANEAKEKELKELAAKKQPKTGQITTGQLMYEAENAPKTTSAIHIQPQVATIVVEADATNDAVPIMLKPGKKVLSVKEFVPAQEPVSDLTPYVLVGKDTTRNQQKQVSQLSVTQTKQQVDEPSSSMEGQGASGLETSLRQTAADNVIMSTQMQPEYQQDQSDHEDNAFLSRSALLLDQKQISIEERPKVSSSKINTSQPAFIIEEEDEVRDALPPKLIEEHKIPPRRPLALRKEQPTADIDMLENTIQRDEQAFMTAQTDNSIPASINSVVNNTDADIIEEPEIFQNNESKTNRPEGPTNASSGEKMTVSQLQKQVVIGDDLNTSSILAEQKAEKSMRSFGRSFSDDVQISNVKKVEFKPVEPQKPQPLVDEIIEEKEPSAQEIRAKLPKSVHISEAADVKISPVKRTQISQHVEEPKYSPIRRTAAQPMQPDDLCVKRSQLNLPSQTPKPAFTKRKQEHLRRSSPVVSSLVALSIGPSKPEPQEDSPVIRRGVEVIRKLQEQMDENLQTQSPVLRSVASTMPVQEQTAVQEQPAQAQHSSAAQTMSAKQSIVFRRVDNQVFLLRGQTVVGCVPLLHQNIHFDDAQHRIDLKTTEGKTVQVNCSEAEYQQRKNVLQKLLLSHDRGRLVGLEFAQETDSLKMRYLDGTIKFIAREGLEATLTESAVSLQRDGKLVAYLATNPANQKLVKETLKEAGVWME